MLKNEEDESVGPAGPEHIGAQLRASNVVVCDVLESRPVDGVKQSLVLQPLGNRLLADGGSPEISTEPLGKSRLAASNRDGATKRSNVRFLHDLRDSTTPVVKVNNPRRMTNNNEGCTVLHMPAAANRKISQRVTQTRNRELSYDPATYAGRLNLAIRAKAQSNGGAYPQGALLADIQRAVGRKLDDPMLVSQQTLSKLQHGKQGECADTPAIAAALGVSSMWLAYGVGPASLIDEIRRQSGR